MGFISCWINHLSLFPESKDGATFGSCSRCHQLQISKRCQLEKGNFGSGANVGAKSGRIPPNKFRFLFG